jgi:hypothetical protein
MTALLALAKADAILLWGPADRTLIAVSIVGTWLARQGSPGSRSPPPASDRCCRTAGKQQSPGNARRLCPLSFWLGPDRAPGPPGRGTNQADGAPS